MDQISRDVFVKAGTECFYVSEYAGQKPEACTITHYVDTSVGGELIFSVSFNAPHLVLGESFFAGFHVDGLRDPGNIIPVRSYINAGAWLNDPVRSVVDVVEHGFLCTDGGLGYWGTSGHVA